MSSMIKPKAIVIGRADVIMLSMIRLLGEYGCEVIVIHLIGKKPPRVKPIDFYSKYVKEYHFVKSDNLIAFLTSQCTDKNQKTVLFALDDQVVFLIDKSLSVLQKHFLCSTVNDEEGGIVGLMDKYVQKEFAKQSGLNVAEGWVIPFIDGEYTIPEGIKYPCFVKGLLCYQNTKGIQKKCNNEIELRSLLDVCKKKAPYPLIAEEFIRIEKEIGIIGISYEENVVIPAWVEKQEVGKGSSNGVTMLGVLHPISANDNRFKPVKRYIESINYKGISNIDLVESDGKLYFVEINFRYAAYGYALRKEGVNLPALFVMANDSVGYGDLKTNITESISLFNEKVGYIGMIEHFWGRKQYRAMKNKANVLMVFNRKDKKPYRRFWLRYLKKYAISLIN